MTAGLFPFHYVLKRVYICAAKKERKKERKREKRKEKEKRGVPARGRRSQEYV